VDQEVGGSRISVAAALNLIHPAGATPRDASSGSTHAAAPSTFQTSDTYALLLGADGKVLESHAFTYGKPAASPPALPRKFPVSKFRARRVDLFTVSSVAGSRLRYRAAAFALSGSRVLVVAVPLRQVDQTLQRLVVVEALVDGAVILALTALGWLVIRVGLRPLARMGRVASEIAHGNLSRRVSPANDRTEVGRLGTSLNDMLVQIEQAFADRSESEDRLRRFLSDASHELRTPLASIRGYAELFRLGAVNGPSELERAMRSIEVETARMGVLVENLLLLARLDELPEAPLVPVDMREIAEHAVHDTRVAAPDREVLLHAPGPVRVLGDPEQLLQAVSNLTRNAVVHTPPRSPIEISVWREGDQAALQVRDHGPGLPPDAGEHLFERFWRIEGGRRRGRGGAGLGLAIVKGIVVTCGGQIHAESAIDGGAIFRVTLPIVQEARHEQ
jgi:two-component system, OmpR family, sensor kinase